MKRIRLTLKDIQKVDPRGRNYPQRAMSSLLSWAVMMKRIDSSKGFISSRCIALSRIASQNVHITWKL